MVRAGSIAGIGSLVILGWGVGYILGLNNGKELERQNTVLSYIDTKGSNYEKDRLKEEAGYRGLPAEIRAFDVNNDWKFQKREVEALVNSNLLHPKTMDRDPTMKLEDVMTNTREIMNASNLRTMIDELGYAPADWVKMFSESYAESKKGR